MSGFLAGKVWQSGLDPALKPTAAALADICDHDGGSLFPRTEYVAWLTGDHPRTTQRHLLQLRAIGILKRVGNATIGRGQSVEYVFYVNKLPVRPKWRKGDKMPPFTEKRVTKCHPFEPEKGDTGVVSPKRTLTDPYVRTHKREGTRTTNKRSTADAFDQFWTVYPRKVGKDAARKAFAHRKFTPAEIETLVQTVEKQKNWPEWTRNGGEFIPHPTKYLNQGRWTDEPHLRSDTPTNAAPTYEDRKESGRMNPWDRILERVEGHVTRHIFHTWFRPVEFRSQTADRITLRVPNDSFATWIPKHYGAILTEALDAIGKSGLQIEFAIS